MKQETLNTQDFGWINPGNRNAPNHTAEADGLPARLGKLNKAVNKKWNNMRGFMRYIRV